MSKIAEKMRVNGEHPGLSPDLFIFLSWSRTDNTRE